MAAEFQKHPFLQSVQEVADTLATHVDTGLSSAQVQELSQKYPPNELDVGGAIPWYTIFIRQLFNAMILVTFSFLCFISEIISSSFCSSFLPPYLA